MLFLFLQLVFWTFVFEAKVAMIQEEHPPAAKLTLRWMGQIILLKEEDITLLLWMVKQVIDRLQNWTCLFVIIGFFSAFVRRAEASPRHVENGLTWHREVCLEAGENKRTIFVKRTFAFASVFTHLRNGKKRQRVFSKFRASRKMLRKNFGLVPYKRLSKLARADYERKHKTDNMDKCRPPLQLQADVHFVIKHVNSQNFS